MYYEINVAKKVKRIGIPKSYLHYFATAPRSITFHSEAVSLLKEFIKLFPAPEYEISIHECPQQFTSYSVDEFLKKFEKKDQKNNAEIKKIVRNEEEINLMIDDLEKRCIEKEGLIKEDKRNGNVLNADKIIDEIRILMSRKLALKWMIGEANYL